MPFVSSRKNFVSDVGFEMLTTVIIKRAVFWNITPAFLLGFLLSLLFVPDVRGDTFLPNVSELLLNYAESCLII
jgi:hypothetical protein